MKQIIAVLTVILMTLTPALAEPAPSRTLDYFWFTHGGELPSQSYEITETDGEFILTRDDDATAQIDSAVLDALMDIIDAYDVAAWDGFHESESYVLDGETFSLSVRFSDGAEVQASGDNRFPDHYHDFSSAVTRLLDTVLDGELTGTYRYEGNGVGGDFTITFEEATKTSVCNKNCIISAHSKSLTKHIICLRKTHCENCNLCAVLIL